MTATIICAVLGIVIGTFIILLINFFTTSHSRKEKSDSEEKENSFLEVGQPVKLTQSAKRAIQTLASSGGDIIEVPGSLIGRFVEVKNLTTKTSVLGIALSEYIYSPSDSDNLYIRINILTSQDLVNVDVPVAAGMTSSIQINFRNTGDTIKAGGIGAVQDIISFCEKQCIFDCNNCILSKYGIRKTRK